MPGDYSRQTFDSARHYSGVLMQQGRVQLDADWNEQQAIHEYRARTTAEDVIGPSGAPKEGGGFLLDRTPDGRDLTISAGRFYTGGLLCELESGPGVTYLAQPDHPLPEFSQPAGTGRVLQLSPGTYLAYLDVWEREVNARLDPLIQEVALGSADTTTRTRVVWQVRLARLAGNPVDCETPVPEWKTLTAPPTGTLNAHTVTPPPSSDPCLLPPTAGYRRLENQLYRVEIHEDGPLGTARFKWSRDNATVETSITAINGTVLSVADVGRDDVLGFAAEQWVEIVDDIADLERGAHPLVQIDHVDAARREITLKSSAAAYAGHANLRLRRWDQSAGATASGVATASSWIALEDGIEVTFGAGTYRAGDYWLIPGRTITGEIEWPPYEIPNTAPVPQSPVGIPHRFARLALVRVGPGNVITRVDDCRERFPWLTHLCAEDICYEPSACGPDFAGALTVQDALDTLCRNHGGGCTYVVSPASDLQAIVDAIPAGADAAICFKAGTYALKTPLTIADKGNIKVVGAGSGTRIVAATSESAVRFLRCTEATVRDLHAESGALATGNQINGALHFVGCAHVDVSGVSARCVGGARRAASCITARHDVRPSESSLDQPSVRITNCDLETGHRQIGVLVLDGTNVQVLGNRIHAAPRPDALRFDRLVATRYYRARIRAALIANAAFGTTVPSGGITNVRVTVGRQVLHFRTPPALKAAWAKYAESHPAGEVTTGQALLRHFVKAVDDMIVNPQARTTDFRQWFELLVNENRSTVFQGIVVAGRVAEEVRVRDNTIEDALQGIHVGVSHRVGPNDAAAGRVDSAGTVQITGNTVEVILPIEATADERHGIFVGNCASLAIEANRVKLRRLEGADKLSIDGIRAYGHIGAMARIQRNHIEGFPTGIVFTPRFPYPAHTGVLWLIGENLAVGASPNRTVVVPGGCPADLSLNRP
ncbi:MAG: hypothetical protein GC151_07710 [Betaproteobacteria bacterium]|nr:hypothetical protein [Betaproteobacteria bacterium]